MKKAKLLILSLGTATLLAACSSADSTSTNASTETTTVAADVTEADVETTEETTEESTEAEPHDSSLSVGEMVTLGDWEIILDSFEITDKIDNTYGTFSASEEFA